MFDKLILGTVQLGIDYGINNDTGKPSITDAIVSLVEVTAKRPNKRAKACTGSISKVNGSNRIMPRTPPNPGTAPIQIPIKTPNTITPAAGQARIA